MATSLQNNIRQLADKFAEGVLQALRSSSLEEILGRTANGSGRATVSAPARRGPGRPPKAAAPAKSNERASDADVTIERIVALLQKKPKGLRSEDLRKTLKL